MPLSGLDWVATKGRSFVVGGREVVLRGVNWFGFETDTLCPHGLWERSLDSMLDQVLALPANLLRLPFCNDIFKPGAKPKAGSVDIEGANPNLATLSCLEILDVVVSECGKRGIRVLLDRHRPTYSAQSELWYRTQAERDAAAAADAEGTAAAYAGAGAANEDDRDTELAWIEDWVSLAHRYREEPCVIGADLHNEPHGE
jgi:endoglucanase